MSIHTIRNNTGEDITLHDGNTVLATVPNDQSVNFLPITITGVSEGNRNYTRTSGSFVNDDSYSATLNGNSITFTGNQAPVVFSVQNSD